jgi:hypothetical protein
MPHRPKRGQTSKSPAIWRDGVRSGGLVTPAASRGGNVTPTRESPTASSVRSSKRGGEGSLRQNHRPRERFPAANPTTSTTTSQWSARPRPCSSRSRHAPASVRAARLFGPRPPHDMVGCVTARFACGPKVLDECSTRHGLAIKRDEYKCHTRAVYEHSANYERNVSTLCRRPLAYESGANHSGTPTATCCSTFHRQHTGWSFLSSCAAHYSSLKQTSHCRSQIYP